MCSREIQRLISAAMVTAKGQSSGDVDSLLYKAWSGVANETPHRAEVSCTPRGCIRTEHSARTLWVHRAWILHLLVGVEALELCEPWRHGILVVAPHPHHQHAA